MEDVLRSLQTLYPALLWPFCRIGAALAMAPGLGETPVPLRARLLLALAFSVIVQPALPSVPAISPISVAGVFCVVQQVLIGSMLGLVFHLVLIALQLAGTLISSQMGLSMAAMNDPVNGSSSDAISALMHVLFLMLFFSMDGHVVLTEALVRSFHVWPIGGAGPGPAPLQRLALSVGWVFAAALALALPMVFVTMAVQLGSGLLNRIAPTFNLFALGFSINVLLGLVLVALMMPALPDQFVRMNQHVFALLDSLAPPRNVMP
jgi:flagellar biosynthesis protein FliR